MIDQVEKNTWEQSEDFKKLKTWQQKFLLTFIQDVILVGYSRWIEDNKEETIDEMIDLTSDLLQGGVDQLFRNLNNIEKTTTQKIVVFFMPRFFVKCGISNHP